MSMQGSQTAGFLGNHFQHTEALPLVQSRWEFPDWIFYVLILSLVILGFIQVFYPKRFRLILRAVFTRNTANQLIREGDIFRERIGFGLFIISLLNISIFVFILLWYFTKIPMHISAVRLFLSISSLVFFIWGVKFLLTNILGDIFQTRSNAKTIQLSNFLIHIFSGLFILLLLFPILYINPEIFIYIALCGLLILFIIKIIRGFIIGSSGSAFSLLHLFLYLCTLEILPYILLIKFGLDFMESL